MKTVFKCLWGEGGRRRQSPEDQDYKGFLLFRAQIGVLHREHKRRLCFVGS